MMPSPDMQAETFIPDQPGDEEGHPYRVLVVDDDPANRMLLRIALECEGYECMEAQNGREGVEAVDSQRIHMVVSDQQMPVMTGMELLHEIQERHKEQSPPVILMSGDHRPTLQHEAKAVGALAFFAKPFQLDTLLQTVRLAVSHQPAPVFSH